LSSNTGNIDLRRSDTVANGMIQGRIGSFHWLLWTDTRTLYLTAGDEVEAKHKICKMHDCAMLHI